MTNPLSSKPLKAVSVPSGSSPDWVAVELVKEFDDNSGPPSGARFGIRGLFIVTAVFSFQFALVSYLGGWAGVMLSPLIAVCMIGVAAIGEIVWGRRGGHQIAPPAEFLDMLDAHRGGSTTFTVAWGGNAVSLDGATEQEVAVLVPDRPEGWWDGRKSI